MDFSNFILSKQLLRFIFATSMSLFSQCGIAMTISSGSTVGVTQTYDPDTKNIIFTATATTANLNNLTIAAALSSDDVVIRDTVNPDVVFIPGTKLIWGNGNNLTINALRNIVINNQAQINSQGNGDLILRADAKGDTEGTLIYPNDGQPAVAMDGGGMVRVFYRPINFTTPTDFTTTIKTSGFGLAKAFMMVNSFADLQNMRLNLIGNYALARNIDAQGLTFAPIGTRATPFKGHFDGQGYIINRLFIYQPSVVDVGLFSDTENATIEDVGLINANVLGGNWVGGLVGYNKVTSPSFFQGSIRRTFVIGNVSGESTVGGLVGYNQGTISQSFTSGGVNCFGRTGYCGGLIGSAEGAIADCFSMSKVTPLEAARMGGLFGSNYRAICSNAYAAGPVEGSSSGGIMGSSDTSGSFFNVFWDITTTGRDKPTYGKESIPGITGLNTPEMTKKDTYIKARWDFDNVWGIEEENYPYLLWTKRTPPWTTMPSSSKKIYKIVG